MDRRAVAGYAASWTTEGTSGEKTVTEAEWLDCADGRQRRPKQQAGRADWPRKVVAAGSIPRAEPRLLGSAGDVEGIAREQRTSEASGVSVEWH